MITTRAAHVGRPSDMATDMTATSIPTTSPVTDSAQAVATPACRAATPARVITPTWATVVVPDIPTLRMVCLATLYL